MELNQLMRRLRHAGSMQCNNWSRQVKTPFTSVVCIPLNPISPCINLLLHAMALNATTQ